MAFNWSEYLKLAQELAQETTDEAKLRSAISRAYYAAFIKSRNFLQQREGLNIPTENTHKYIINYFMNSSEPARIKIGRRLLRLRGFRNQADYDNIFPLLIEKTKESLTLARRIISSLDNL